MWATDEGVRGTRLSPNLIYGLIQNVFSHSTQVPWSVNLIKFIPYYIVNEWFTQEYPPFSITRVWSECLLNFVGIWCRDNLFIVLRWRVKYLYLSLYSLLMALGPISSHSHNQTNTPLHRFYGVFSRHMKHYVCFLL